MSPGTLDLILLILAFLGLQAWWIIPIVKKNIKINEKAKELGEEIQHLERLYRK